MTTGSCLGELEPRSGPSLSASEQIAKSPVESIMDKSRHTHLPRNRGSDVGWRLRVVPANESLATDCFAVTDLVVYVEAPANRRLKRLVDATNDHDRAVEPATRSLPTGCSGFALMAESSPRI